MLRTFCKSKIYEATVTQAEVHYEGSITIDEELMHAADILPYERVQVLCLDNGQRLETYAIPGEKGSGIIGMNGAAAKLIEKGHKVLIISYIATEKYNGKPKLVKVEGDNKIVENEPTHSF
ncbi:aspartate 1-decarboxylase [Nanoarchaeota archaeon]